MDQLVGQTLGRYRITSLLGQGGMGAVYKGYDETLKRDVAIKVMNPQMARQGNFQDRFIQEARTVARLSHPGIVQVYDFGQDKSQLFIVMEFLPGTNLGQKIKDLRGKGQWINLDEGVHIIEQVAKALDYAHRRGVLHRDMKPDNIMLRQEPSDNLPYRPVIMDMGLAKLAEGGVETQVGTTMGTPQYMSPEQALGKTVGAASDIYSIGVILFELCTGRVPFPARNLTEAVKFHTQQPPPAPRSIKADLPPAVEQVILKALQKDPAQRYPTAGDMAEALESALPSITKVGQTPQPAAQADPGRPTQYQETPDKMRAPSTNDFGPVGRPGQDQVQVLYQNGKRTSAAIKPDGTLTIGRENDNDIILDDQQASRHHVRIQYDGKMYRITDLNSRNGTFLEDAKLLPGIPEPWPPEKALRIGSTFLHLQRAEDYAKSVVAPPPPVPGTPAPPPKPAPSPIGIILQNDQINVEPGKTTMVMLTVNNQGPLVDHYNIIVQGIPANWMPAPVPVLQLMPGAQQLVNITISPPRSSKSRAGDYPVVIRITSRDVPDRSSEAKVTITVTSFHQFTSELFPQKIRAGKTSRVKITNLSNTTETFRVLWQDRGVELEFKPSQAEIKVGEGQEAFAEFKAKPRQRQLIGMAKTTAFSDEVSCANVETQVHNGELVSQPIIPIWLITLLLLLCMCLAAAALFAFSQYQTRNNKATETAGVNTQLALGTANQQTADAKGTANAQTATQVATNNLPTFTPTSTITPKPTVPPYQACPDTYPSHLHIGDHATISMNPPLPQRLRSEATTKGGDATVIGFLPPGEEVVIQQGPTCADGWVWWKVTSVTSGKTGWTSEGDGVNYWLVPK